MKQSYLWVLYAYVIILTTCALQIPFFWDTILFSKIAHWFINTNFSSLALPEYLDTGNQPFFCLLLGLCWKIFGKTLIVSHLMMLPFLIGIAHQYWLLVTRFVDPRHYWIAVFLFVLEPSLMSQSTQVGIDIPLLFFYLLGLNAILNNSTSFLILATLGLSLTNLRGDIAIGALFLTQIYVQGFSVKNSLKSIKYYTPVAICIVAWFVYHKTQSGWAFVQQGEWAEHRAILGIVAALKNLMFIAWRFADFGRLLPYTILGILLIYKFYKRSINSKEIHLLYIIAIPSILFSLFFMPISNPIGHRYYLISYVLFLPLITIVLASLNDLYRKVLISLISLSLLTGPFIIYANPYTNGWDSTIAHLRYFSLRKEMRAYIEQQHISPNAIAARFPHHADFRYTDLDDTSLEYVNSLYHKINEYDYVLYCNISNTYTSAEIQDLKQNWILDKRIDNWPVFMLLYKKK